MKGGFAMKNNVYEFKKKTFHSEEKGLYAKSLIDLDQPFDYEEVAAITGSEYVRYLHREGMPFISYEELKRNVADLRVKAVERPKYTMVSGFQVADDCYHHIGHSWVYLVDEDTVRIGIDDFTTKVFGPADKIALPAVGSALKQGEVGWVLTRNGHEAPMQAPVSGTVYTVNNKMKERPEIVHHDPYEAGWLFLLEPFRLEDDLKELYFGEACLQWLEEENQFLLELLAPRYERLAATGGGLVDDIYGHFPEIDWDRLVKTFLRTEVKS
jgi:glycine cleavage system H lipoate-binding protein